MEVVDLGIVAFLGEIVLLLWEVELLLGFILLVVVVGGFVVLVEVGIVVEWLGFGLGLGVVLVVGSVEGLVGFRGCLVGSMLWYLFSGRCGKACSSRCYGSSGNPKLYDS